MSKLRERNQSIMERLHALFNGFQKKDRTLLQRRRHLRVVPTQADVVCQQGREQHRAILRDVSANGMRVMLTRRIAPGTVLSVLSRHASSRGEVSFLKTRVVWCIPVRGHYEAGLACTEAPHVVSFSWLQRLLGASGQEAENQADRRTAPRVSAVVDVTLRWESKTVNAQLVDLGFGGARLECSDRIGAGATVEVVLPTTGPCRGVALTGVVLRVNAVNGVRTLHVKFETLDERRGERLNRYLRHMMKMRQVA